MTADIRRVHIVHGQPIGPRVGDRLAEHTTRARLPASGYLLAVEGKGPPGLVLAGLLIGVSIVVDPVEALPFDLLLPPPDGMTAEGPWDSDDLGPWGQRVELGDLVVVTVQNPSPTSAVVSLDFHVAERRVSPVAAPPSSRRWGRR